MQPKLKNQTSDLSLDGLEGLLDSAKQMQSGKSDDTTTNGNQSSQDWTLEETARALGLSRGAVIRRLEDGILAGYRVKRSYGWVWRVKPSWINSSRKITEEDDSRAKQDGPSNQVEASPAPNCPFEAASTAYSTNGAIEVRDKREFVEVFDVCEESVGLPSLPQASVRELIELKTKLEMTEFQFQDAYKRLETANYKIGYLEARLEASQEQLKLINASQEKLAWWRRWRQWFSQIN